jgi:hypothetical protein
MIHEAQARQTLKALRLDVHFARIETEERRVEFLLGDARIADATAVAPLRHDSRHRRARRGRENGSTHVSSMAERSRSRRRKTTRAR